jgi:ABC-2 type transport system ATP-binding protein
LENVLSIRNLTKDFGRIRAVNNLNLDVKAGQVFGMLGPNGSGKTTTLGMLMGVTNPSAGDFSWFGEPPTHHLRKKIGAVLEHPIFYPYLSGQKNLELNAMIKQCDVANIPKVLELVELKDRKDDKYKTYSLGMKQRLAMARAGRGDRLETSRVLSTVPDSVPAVVPRRIAAPRRGDFPLHWLPQGDGSLAVAATSR